MTCTENKALIQRGITASPQFLTRAERTAMSDHLGDCEPCRNWLDQLCTENIKRFGRQLTVGEEALIISRAIELTLEDLSDPEAQL